VAGFIAAQRADHGVPHAVSCQALGVSQAWFYKWRRGDASLRRARRERLKAEVRRLFAGHKGKRGSPMITADLHGAGWRVGKNTVAGLMAEMGLAARPKKRRKGATRPGKGRWRAPDLVRRDFPAAAINQKWYGDGTQIGTDEGTLYLDSVLDAGSRRVLGFALGEHHDAPLAYGALAMAVAVRGGTAPGVIFHTDQGSEGEFNWSSHHFDHGGVRWGRAGSRCRRRPRVLGGSGRRIGRCGRRCGHRAGLSRLVPCSGSSGG
jgi:putative transposase